MIKKVINLITVLIITLCLIISNNVFAKGYNSEENNNKDYYMETGKIDLQSISSTFYIENESLKNSVKNDDFVKLMNEFELSPGVEEAFIQMMEKGMTPVGVGYTVVELKEVTDSNGDSHLEPMTNSDKMKRVVSKGNLRLSMSVGKSSSNIYNAVTIAEWKTDFQFSASNRPAAGYDLITVTAPQTFQYASSRFESRTSGFMSQIPSENYDRVGLSFNQVVYVAMEFVDGQYSALSLSAWMNCTGTISQNNNMFIGSYCHNWANGVPSFSLAPGFVSITNSLFSWSIPVEYFW